MSVSAGEQDVELHAKPPGHGDKGNDGRNPDGDPEGGEKSPYFSSDEVFDC